MNAEKLKFLKNGDQISLYATNHEGYLYSEGFLDTTCSLVITAEIKKVSENNRNQLQTTNKQVNSEAANRFREFLFEIYPQLRYSAWRTLKKHLNQVETETQEERVGEVSIRELNHNLNLEQEANKKEIQRLRGKEISYGTVVQLCHAKSGKFLSILPKESNGGTALAVVLSEGNDGSWFHIRPKYKVRSEGEKVVSGDQIVLESLKWNICIDTEIITQQEESVVQLIAGATPTPGEFLNILLITLHQTCF